MKILFWILTILATIFFGLIDFMSFDEWRIVKLKKDIGGYPWGPINDNPWYYANPDLYAIVMLTEFILMTILLGSVIRNMIKKDKPKILYSLLACFVFFVIIIINGMIQ